MNSTQLDKGNKIQSHIQFITYTIKSLEAEIRAGEGAVTLTVSCIVQLNNSTLSAAGLPSGRQIVDAYINQLQIELGELEKQFEAL